MNSYLNESPGGHLRKAIEEERPLQMVGTINAFCSLLAEREPPVVTLRINCKQSGAAIGRRRNWSTRRKW